MSCSERTKQWSGTAFFGDKIYTFHHEIPTESLMKKKKPKQKG